MPTTSFELHLQSCPPQLGTSCDKVSRCPASIEQLPAAEKQTTERCTERDRLTSGRNVVATRGIAGHRGIDRMLCVHFSNTRVLGGRGGEYLSEGGSDLDPHKVR